LSNDSVFGEALEIEECVEYARVAGFDDNSGVSTDDPKPSTSGYQWLGTGTDRLLAVAGDLVTPHLPGHAHVHPAHIWVWVGGQRVITDTGVYEYAAGERRHRSRTVENHNTIQVDGTEPVRLGDSFHWWGTVNPTFERQKNNLKIAYEVGGLGRPAYTHKRMIRRSSDGWKIRDRVDGVDNVAESRFHVHPSLTVQESSEEFTVVNESGEAILTVVPQGHDDASTKCAPYYPEYGTELERDVILIRRKTSGEFGVRFHVA
jgi:hypothetical protein